MHLFCHSFIKHLVGLITPRLFNLAFCLVSLSNSIAFEYAQPFDSLSTFNSSSSIHPVIMKLISFDRSIVFDDSCLFSEIINVNFVVGIFHFDHRLFQWSGPWMKIITMTTKSNKVSRKTLQRLINTNSFKMLLMMFVSRNSDLFIMCWSVWHY